ncbi:MAG: YybH family protein, partial [Miltoncostaeaceae bacterium]
GDSDQTAVLAVHKRWHEALRSVFAGDPEPFRSVYPRSADAAYVPAEGGLLVGFEAAYEDWRRQAARSPGATVEVVEVHATAGEEMAGTQTVIEVTITGPDGARRTGRARETSLYRREAEGWRVVMPQADALTAWNEVMEAGDPS